MLQKGSYVRLVSAPNTRKGTIADVVIGDDGKAQFKFHHDERFKDTLPDFYRPEHDFEECDRPSDGEVELINKLIEHGS
jgi:hypothetical protein